MKVTFNLSPSLVRRLRAHISKGKRSDFVSNLISKELSTEANAIERAGKKANTLGRVNRDMKDWQALNHIPH
jgi:hypothetical protein